LFVDLVDLDVGKPERPPGTAFDNAAAEASTELEREVGAGSRLDQLRPLTEQPRVEGACRRLIRRVQLQMHNWPRLPVVRVHITLDPRRRRNPSLLQALEITGLSPATIPHQTRAIFMPRTAAVSADAQLASASAERRESVWRRGGGLGRAAVGSVR
jgi:hypothetical protein